MTTDSFVTPSMIKGQEKLLFTNHISMFCFEKKKNYDLNVKAEYPSKASTVKVTGRGADIISNVQY